MFRIFGLLIAAAVLTAPAQAVAFLSTIEDMPLMDGMTETGAPTVFETPFGRIIEAEAIGAGDRRDVERFYSETLPALGWRAAVGADDAVFERGDEQLQITVTAKNGSVAAKFRLIARPASSRMAP